MSWFDWLKPKRDVYEAHASTEFGHEAGDTHHPGATTDGDFKAQRQGRRESLYSVIREALLRSEVLASRYKFKVLSLDSHGRQFLVMIDLLDATALPPQRFLAVEQLIVSHSTQQHGLFVKAVYWRANETMPEAAHVVPPASVKVEPPPAPRKPEVVAPVPVPVAVPLVSVRPKSSSDPIDQDEVMAFKKAIGALQAESPNAKPGQVRNSGARKPGYMMGYEDTQLLDDEDAATPLSRTQFGEL
jgi:hypothetical protein